MDNIADRGYRFEKTYCVNRVCMPSRFSLLTGHYASAVGVKTNTSHGDMNGAHGLTLKSVMFEECQRVPFVIVGKGIKQNYADKNTLVCNGLDFIPTICDLAGIEYPKGLPGISLKPYLTGQGKKPDRKYIITENRNGYQINDGRYKYTIYELPGYPEMLTDLEKNLRKTNNYSTDQTYNEIKVSLKRDLMAELTKRGLTPLPENRKIGNIEKLE